MYISHVQSSEEKTGQVQALESNPGEFDLFFFCPSIKDLNHNPFRAAGSGPLGPLGFNLAPHSPTTRPSVERTADKAFLLSERV
jgi:hypothetical protein